MSRSIGKAVREFRRASDEIQGQDRAEIQASEFKEIKVRVGKKDFSQDIYKEITEDKEEKRKQEAFEKDLSEDPTKKPPRKKREKGWGRPRNLLTR